MIDFESGTNFKSYFTWNFGNQRDAIYKYNLKVLKKL
jgi:hypothetical protein